MRRSLILSFGVVIALLARAEIAHAACTEAGACTSNEYCAIDDGGVVVTDGGAGVCLPEPCVISADCSNGELCDTSRQPFKCVECISTADCPGVLQCDLGTHTCVQPITPDAGEDGGSVEDAAVDSGEAIDATTPIGTNDASVLDANATNEASTPVAFDAGPPDTGSLAGGAFDCTFATPRDLGVAAFGAPLALGLMLFARRRSRNSRR